MWDPQRLTALWASTACYRDSFTFKPATTNIPTTKQWAHKKEINKENNRDNNHLRMASILGAKLYFNAELWAYII
jgi:hypothetical protein